MKWVKLLKYKGLLKLREGFRGVFMTIPATFVNLG
jgi:hypothetical protein